MTNGLLLAAVAAALAASPAAAQTLAVEVEAVRSSRGQLFVSLVDSAQQRVSRQIVAAATGTIRVEFTGLKPGDYAVRIFHDENGDGLFDKNMLGLPVEGYAFSNRARARFGPPSFKAMRVHIAAEVPAATHARMTY